MFIQLLKYRIKSFLKPSQELFWSVAFPFILGTLFYLALSNVMTGAETFSSIDVAIVEETAMDSYFSDFLDSVDQDSDTHLINVTKCSMKDATDKLNKKEVAGILTVNKELSLTVNEEGYDQSILKSIVDQYQRTAVTVETIAKTYPEKMQDAIAVTASSLNTNKEITLSNHTNTDPMTNYYYSLIAMACLFSCMFGFRATINSQANLSTLAARRAVSPAHRLCVITTDFLGSLIIQFASVCLLICYLAFVLHVNFGDRLPFVFLTAFVGCVIGISLGIFITSVGRFSAVLKLSFLIAITLFLCFLSGLMVSNMKEWVEEFCPIANRLNPAALINDSLYSLSIFDNYSRYGQNMIILVIMAVVLCFASFIVTRRERYASI
ncbi:MAG: ABC transporter permease [bacterium]|nr:ABC transporter permease [bacterium]